MPGLEPGIVAGSRPKKTAGSSPAMTNVYETWHNAAIEGNSMQELIEEVAAATGLASGKAEQAVGIILSLVRNQGDKARVRELFDKLPGADALADRHGGDGARGGGLLGMLGGGLMGGPLAAIGKLQAAGLSMDQIRTLGRLVLDHARAKAGDNLVRQVAGSIPGLSGYL